MTTIATPPAPRPPVAPGRWQRFAAGCVRAFRAYANWLVGISWKRFFLLSLLLLIAAGILSSIPPFSWRIHERVVLVPHIPTKAERAKARDSVHIWSKSGYEISVDENGVRIGPQASAPAASAASGAQGAASAPEEARASKQLPSVNIKLPPGADSDDVRQAVEDARDAVAEAMSEAGDAAREIARETATGHRVVSFSLGGF